MPDLVSARHIVPGIIVDCGGPTSLDGEELDVAVIEHSFDGARH